jgi:hypothetical protein
VQQRLEIFVGKLYGAAIDIRQRMRKDSMCTGLTPAFIGLEQLNLEAFVSKYRYKRFRVRSYRKVFHCQHDDFCYFKTLSVNLIRFEMSQLLC